MGAWDTLGEWGNTASQWGQNNPLQALALISGLTDMGYGAADRSRYNRQMASWNQRAMDPNGWQAYYQPMSGAAQQQVLRGLNANNAMSGIADGQFGQQRVADALARLEQGRINGSMGAYNQALTNQGRSIRQPYGGGTLQGIMQQLQILRSLGNGQAPNMQPRPRGEMGPYNARPYDSALQGLQWETIPGEDGASPFDWSGSGGY